MEAQEVREKENAASEERRSSISELQGVLNRVTLSPFHSKYKALLPSNLETSNSSAPVLGSKQESGLLIDLSNDVNPFSSQTAQNSSSNPTNPFLPTVQNDTTVKARNSYLSATERMLNGLHSSSVSINPFYTQDKNTNISAVEEKNNIQPSVEDIFSKSKPNDGLPQASTSAEKVDPWKVDFFSAVPPENNWAVFPSSVSNQEAKHLPDTHTSPSWLSETPQTGQFDQEVNIFQPYKANKASGISWNVVASKNSEPSQSTERDHLLEYIFANQKNEDESTLPTNGEDIFQDTPSFFPPPVITQDVFQSPDMFTAVPSSESSDKFHAPFSNSGSKPFQSSLSFQTKTSLPSDIRSFDPLANDYIAKDDRVELPESPLPKAPLNGGLMFRRRHPKPTPRSKVLKNPIQAIDHQSLSHTAQESPAFTHSYTNNNMSFLTSLQSVPTTPTSTPLLPTSPVRPSFQATDHQSSSQPAKVPPRFTHPTSLRSIQTPPTSTPPLPTSSVRPSFQNQMNTSPENNGQVYEDILFIGQERCVEDWPEDSPELSPEQKPTGRLKLRRESVKISEDAARELNHSESSGKKPVKLKLGQKLRPSISRRGSKDKLGNGTKVPHTGALDRDPQEKNLDSQDGARGGTLPWGTKFHDGASENIFSSDPDDRSEAFDSKKVKKRTKSKYFVPQLNYRISKDNLLRDVSKLQKERKLGNGEEKQQEMKDNQLEPLQFQPFGHHQQSKGTEPGPVPEPHLNDFLIIEESKENTNMKTDAEKNHSAADFSAFTFNEEGATGYTPLREPQVSVVNEDEIFSGKSTDHLTFLDNDGKRQEMQDVRPKRPLRLKVPRLPRRSLKRIADDVPQKGADLFKASDVRSSEFGLASKEFNQQRKPPILMVPPLSRRDSKDLEDAETPMKGADLFKAGDYKDAETWMEEYSPDTKPQKFNSHTPSRDSKVKDQSRYFGEDIDTPGATSGDFYLSEAAKAEWMSSQMDLRRSRGPEEEERLEGVQEEEEGDTDSLMEWWNTVELWDELPSNEEITLQEDETKSFTEIAGKVHHGLRVFYKVFTEQAEVLYQHVLFLYAIADDISNFHRRAKTANITGGTTAAVGGVAAIAGLALAPVTFGASLIVSAVGLGVATAGGITAASAAISDNVHDMNDRKKIEVVVQDYKTRLTEFQRCLHFIAEGIRRLRCHPLLRRNNYYAGDWEVRRALQTISLVTEPVERAEEIVNGAMFSLNSICTGIDKYFSKDSRELKKGCKKEVTMKVRMLAKQLHDGLVELSSIREQLLDASGNI